MGRPPRLLHRSPEHQPVSVKQLAISLPPTAYQDITWREGSEQKLRSRFAAVRIRPAHRDYWQAEPHAEEWLLIEWPKSEKEPTKYWVSTLPENTTRKALIKIAKHRWIIERDYEELKQELGLGISKVAIGGGSTITQRYALQLTGFWWQSETVFPPLPAPVILDSLPPSQRRNSAHAVRRVRPERHNPHSIATLRINLAHWLTQQLPRCPYCGSSPR
jgi:hypothetical protein